MLARLAVFETITTSKAKTSQVIRECLACVVAEPSLVKDQVEDVEQLLSLGALADQFAPFFL